MEKGMIDYYYEFPQGMKMFDQPTRYAIQRGYHPEYSTQYQRTLHGQCYEHATRIWLENANGAVLIRQHGRDIHEKIQPKELTWIKLQAREIEIL
jgi:hypothetical protein